MNSVLVKNQHVLPAKSISRFCNENGMVQIYRIESNNIFFKKPDDEIFCVSRVWDQRAERGFGKLIEDNYQSVIDRVLVSGCRSLSGKDNQYISAFYALWCLRSSIENYDELMAGNLVGVDGDDLTDDQKLNAELKHGMYVNKGGEVPMHFKRGLAMQMAINNFLSRNPNLTWFVVESKEVEFIISDNPKGEFIIPFMPKLCFICSIKIPVFSVAQVREINMRAISRSKSYYFAKKLSADLYY